MTRNGFKKGEYEEAVERAKYYMEKGLDGQKIIEMTNLTQQDIDKIKSKTKKEFDDKL